LVQGWVTVFRQYVTSHPGQLSLLPSVGRGSEYRPKCDDALQLKVKT